MLPPHVSGIFVPCLKEFHYKHLSLLDSKASAVAGLFYLNIALSLRSATTACVCFCVHGDASQSNADQKTDRFSGQATSDVKKNAQIAARDVVTAKKDTSNPLHKSLLLP